MGERGSATLKKIQRGAASPRSSAALLTAAVVTAVPSGESTTTLKLWENYGTEQNAVALKNLAKAFTKRTRPSRST